MALTRKFLSALGIEADKIDEIIGAHTETIEAIKRERDSLKEKSDQFDQLKIDHDTLKKKVADLEDENKKLTGSNQNYETLKKEYEDYKLEIQNKDAHAKKVAAYKDILKDAGIPERHWDKIVKYSSVDEIEFDDKGKVKTSKDILENVKKEWADHIETTHQNGGSTETPPNNNGGQNNTSSHAAERVAQYHANLYGAVKKD